MKRGRQFKKGNTFGRGRPKGSRNKRTLLAKQLLDEYAPAIFRKTVAMALEGDKTILCALLRRMLPRAKEPPCRIGPLPMGNMEELSRTCETTLKKAATGKITLGEAAEVLDLVEKRRRTIEGLDLEKRVAALEQSRRGTSIPARPPD
jgi:hypothetical protein